MALLPQSRFIAPDNFSIDEGGRILLHYNEQHSSCTPAESKMELDSPKVEFDWSAWDEIDEFDSLARQHFTQAELDRYQNERTQYQKDYSIGPYEVPHNPAMPVFEEWTFAYNDTSSVDTDVDMDVHDGKCAIYIDPSEYEVISPSPSVADFDLSEIEQPNNSAQLSIHMSQLNLDGGGFSSETADTNVHAAGTQAGYHVASTNFTAVVHSSDAATVNVGRSEASSDAVVIRSETSKPKTDAEIIASYRPMVLSNVSTDYSLRFWTVQKLAEECAERQSMTPL